MIQVLLQELARLEAAWAALQPMQDEYREKLQRKMRLEWNYNSNHIEGNTLTYGETELLLIFGETKGHHEFREYEEMKGHDVALKMVEELAEDSAQPLTEAFIRELNRVILKEPFYKEAITPDGQATRRLISIGEYKKMPNSVRLPNGEMFHYATPAETPAQMQELMDWYRQAAADAALHPVVVAAELHYRFVLIHPFDDGNGRLSRLLMNYHLLRCGHLPVIVKSADKKNYLRALHEADTGNTAAFAAYIAECLLWSYQLGIKAAKGESVEEPGDWEKKLALLEKKIPKTASLEKRKKDLPMQEFADTVLLPLTAFLLTELHAIRNLFFEATVVVRLISTLTNKHSDFGVIKEFINYIAENKDAENFDYIWIDYSLTGFKKNGVNSFNLTYETTVALKDYEYTFSLRSGEDIIRHYYHQGITEADKDAIAARITEDILQKTGTL